MNRGFVATVIVFQLVLLAIFSFINLSMRSELSILSEHERKVISYKVVELANSIYSNWLELNSSNANEDAYALCKEKIIEEWKEFYPSLNLTLYSFNSTLLSFEVEYRALNIKKSYYVENG